MGYPKGGQSAENFDKVAINKNTHASTVIVA